MYFDSILQLLISYFFSLLFCQSFYGFQFYLSNQVYDFFSMIIMISIWSLFFWFLIVFLSLFFKIFIVFNYILEIKFIVFIFSIIIIIIIIIVIVIVIVIMMVLLINNNSDSDFDPYFLNCYFLKSFCMIRIIFFNFIL
jgi:hypothetical protein